MHQSIEIPSPRPPGVCGDLAGDSEMNITGTLPPLLLMAKS